MKILLDTHVWIWIAESPDELGSNARSLLEDLDNEIFISPISTLEIAQLVKSGKIELKHSLSAWVRKSMSEVDAKTAPFTHDTAEMAYKIPEPFHKDPADRILAATAILENLGLMTADEKILGNKHIRTINARK
ncbi:MAG TPA: hypothetical protein DET40_13365 [Lentisphaeria bacterium]|nr:MAG: hypothetical protein A2X45_22710 [Lentisphaerae bacterium GWF2_50_93]HCE44530.1 hypothetical protein [Lentisphaeria bacterium]